jgi:hypothetical protein
LGIDFFEQQWATYHAIVVHDLMEHQALFAACATALETWLQQRRLAQPTASAPTMVDLGCGDLTTLAPLLRRMPLGSYTGLDLTASVLPVAAATLGPVPYPTHWCAGDLLGWATSAAANTTPIDILHSAFAIHHLNDEAKETMLRGARERIHPEGLFLWADVFRGAGESEGAAIARYSKRVKGDWWPLTERQRQQTIAHIRSLDHPADRMEIQRAAEASGWHWQWLWQGEHDSEALALLTPA